MKTLRYLGIPKDTCMWVILIIGKIKLQGYIKSILKLYSLLSIPLCPHYFYLDHCDNLCPLYHHQAQRYKKDLSKILSCCMILSPPKSGQCLKKSKGDKNTCAPGSIYHPNMHYANHTVNIQYIASMTWFIFFKVLLQCISCYRIAWLFLPICIVCAPHECNAQRSQK